MKNALVSNCRNDHGWKISTIMIKVLVWRMKSGHTQLTQLIAFTFDTDLDRIRIALLETETVTVKKIT